MVRLTFTNSSASPRIPSAGSGALVASMRGRDNNLDTRTVAFAVAALVFALLRVGPLGLRLAEARFVRQVACAWSKDYLQLVDNQIEGM